MYNPTYKTALDVHEKRKADRANHDRTWDEIAYLMLPSQSGFITEFVEGETSRWSHRFDSTALFANELVSNHIHMSLMNPATKWVEMRFSDPDVQATDTAKEWAQDTSKRMLSAYAASNFDGEANTLLQGLNAFGTATMDINFQFGRKGNFELIFEGTKLSHCTFDVDAQKRIDTKVTEYEFTAKQADEMFDHDFGDAKKIKVIKIVRPNSNYVVDSLNIKERSYLVEWVHRKELIKEETAYEKPFIAVRAGKADYEPIYGEGFGVKALCDARGINKAKRLESRGHEKAIDPALIVSANAVMSDLHTEAGGVTVMRNPRDIGELPGRMDMAVVNFKGEELRDQINKTYHIDQLVVPERKGQNPATATEIQVRYEQSQRTLGAMVGRIKSEWLVDMHERVFGLMLRNGQLAPIPDELRGLETEVVFNGPLAKAQTSNDAVAGERATQLVMGVGEVAPEAAMVIDWAKMIRGIIDQYGIPADWVRSEKEVQKMQAAQEKAMQEQGQREAAMENAQLGEQQALATTANVEAMSQVRGV